MSEFIGTKRGPWDGEQRPLYLAPMSGVTDLPYRLLAKECGADVTITEFTTPRRHAGADFVATNGNPRNGSALHSTNFRGDPGDMATAAEKEPLPLMSLTSILGVQPL